MKNYFNNLYSVIIAVIFSVAANSTTAVACEPPTTHAILYAGACLQTIGLDLRGISASQYKPLTDKLGCYVSLGVETPRRVSCCSVQYKWTANGTHQVGVTESLCLVPIWCYSPVNVRILFGGGAVTNNGVDWYAYSNVGGEIAFGQLHSYFQFFVRDEHTFIFGAKSQNFVSAGFRFFIGKDW